MSFFQISAVLFALYMLYLVRMHQKKMRSSVREALLWYSLWLVFIFLSVFPTVLTGISNFFVFDRVFDLLIVGAFMVIAFLVVRTYFKSRELSAKIDKLVREIASSNLKKSLKEKRGNR